MGWFYDHGTRKARSCCVLTPCHSVQTWLLVKKRLLGADNIGGRRCEQGRLSLAIRGHADPPQLCDIRPPTPRPHERPVGKAAREQVAEVGREHGLLNAARCGLCQVGRLILLQDGDTGVGGLRVLLMVEPNPVSLGEMGQLCSSLR